VPVEEVRPLGLPEAAAPVPADAPEPGANVPPRELVRPLPPADTAAPPDPPPSEPADRVDALVAQVVHERPLPADPGALTTLSGIRIGRTELGVPDLGPASLGGSGSLQAPAGGAPPSAAPRIRGTLVESGSRRPVSLARVILTDERGAPVSGAMSDSNGSFSISAPSAGEFYLNASALGYRETTMGVELGEGREIDVEFRIEASPLPVAGLVVENVATLTASGFYQRLDQGIGRFLTPEDIESARGHRVTDLLETLPRIDVVREFGSERVLMMGSGGRCAPRVYVNGALVPGEAGSLDAIAPLLAVEAMEIYSSPVQVPLQWAGAAYPGSREACGAIVIWTKG
jgi:hypothetical protein